MKKGKRRLLAWMLCLVVTLTDGGSMGLQVMAKELTHENTAVVDSGSEATDNENSTGDNTSPAEGDTNSNDEVTPSEGNNGEDDAGSSGIGSDTGSESDLVEDTDKDQASEGTQEGESAPGETENESAEGTDSSENRREEIEENTVQAERSVTASGKCGDKLTWTLENGTLTISGTGDMYDYHSNVANVGAASPWLSYFNNINKLVIEEGVTSIGNGAFHGYVSNGSEWIPESVKFVGELSIPSSLTCVGDYAFYDCNGLTGNLVIPDNVRTIGNSAFEGCSGFTGNLVISNNVTVVGNSAFEGCSGFTGNLVISNNVTVVGNNAFEDCSGFNGNLIIGDSVKEIGSYAFKDCNNLTGNLVIPDNVKHIGDEAFYRCTDFTGSLTLGNSVTDIGDYAFYSCDGFTGNLILPDSLISIGRYAFCDCGGFTGNLTIPDNVNVIEDSAFCGCSGFTGNLTIPDNVTVIGDSAFYECSGFNGNLKIGNNVENIESSAFAFCSGFNGNLFLGNNVKKIDVCAFTGCSGFIGDLVIPNSVMSIEHSAFAGCNGFNGNLTLGNNVELIGGAAFRDCNGFTGDLIIPDSVTTLGEAAFNNCSGFTGNLVISKNITSIKSAGWERGTFENCSGFTGSLIIPDSVKEIGKNAFRNCSSFTGSLTIGKNVTEIGSFAFGDCTGFTGDLIIPDSVTYIGSGAFRNCKNFTGSLIIGNGLTAIDSQTFENCSGLKGKLTIGSSVTHIGGGAFSGCQNLTGDLIIPDSVTSIDNRVHIYNELTHDWSVSTYSTDGGAFLSCGFTGNLKISSNVTEIQGYTFSGCKRFTGNLTIPDNVTKIGDSAFADCGGFTGNLIIPNNVTSIGSCAFFECKGFTGGLSLPSSVTEIGCEAFSGCSGFTGNLTIPNRITKIEPGVFRRCGFTGTLTIPNRVTIIGGSSGHGAFSDCSGFTGRLTIPNSVTEIGEDAFSGCSGFTGSLKIGNNVKNIGSGAFSDCSSFTNLVLPNSITEIKAGTFKNCSGFTGNLIIPNSIITIGGRTYFGERGAFEGCSGFTCLTLSNNVTWIDEYSFSGCTGFSGDLVIPNSVTEIGKSAFEDCNNFTGNVKIPDNVTNIGNSAFSNCNGINNIIFEGNVPTIGTNTFYDIAAKTYYPSWKSGWDSNVINKNYGGTLTWIPYAEGFAPWEMDGSSTAPGIWFALETNPKTISYKDGYNCSKFDMNVTVICMLRSIEAPTYDNVTVQIELSDGLSFSENADNKSFTRNLGTMNFDGVKKHDISLPVYIDQDYITSEFQVTITITADGYESAQTKTFSIPVNLSVEKAESIIDAVDRYTSGDEIREVSDILASNDTEAVQWQRLFEYYNYDDMLGIADRISTLSATHRESWDYESLIQNELYLSHGYYNYLNNTTKGKGARACLYLSGLAYNGEIKDWIDLPTYLNGDYPGVKKYKSMLEEFIKKESTQIEYYSYMKTTQNFINDSVGICSRIEKGEALKELGKTKNTVGGQSVFNNFCKSNIRGLDGKEIVFDFEETTPLMEAMDVVGTTFKMTNLTVDSVTDFVEVSANLEIYKTYHNFLKEIYEADDLPWELVVAAYKLDKEMEDAYWTPVKKILKTIRDECFDKALDLNQFSAIAKANSYLAIVNFTSFVINQFVDVGELVVNACQTEGYAFLAMHYRNKLVQCKNSFLADKSAENAWAFYETYIMLWKLRIAGEEKYLEMNKLEGGKTVDNLSQWATGGTLSGLISDICGYKDKEEAVKDNLKLLESYAFKYTPKELPDELMYLSKVMIECPVDVELISADGTPIYTLNDKEEISASNDYGRFVSFYRATTGDYVKIAYLNNADSIKINAKGTEDGDVSYTYVETENHETYEAKGFNNVLVNQGSSIQIETDKDTYIVDQDADGIIDIEGEQADKKRIFIQFDYQDGKTIKVIYVNEDGSVTLPSITSSDNKVFHGWYTEPNGAGEKFTSEDAVTTSKTVYAKWGNAQTLEKPSANIASGSTVAKGTEIMLSCTDSEAQIFYTLDETDPTEGSNQYIEPIVINSDIIIKAIAIKAGNQSEIVVFGYRVEEADNPSEDDNKAGDILPEDIPSDGIPSGLWIATIKDYTYTGQPIKPEVHVYDSKIRLKEGQDYTVTYKNNTKANNASGAKNAPTVVIKGKGSYTGTETATFTIRPVDLEEPSVVSENLTVVYNSKVQKKVPIVSYKGKKLTNNKDFTVSYPDLTRGVTEAYCATGTYDILLTAKEGGNFTGTRTVKLIITKGVLLSKVTIKKIPNQPYTGFEIEPDLNVTTKNIPLVKDTDYTVTYTDNKDIGKATAILTGIGEYTGTKKVTFNIVGTSLKKAVISGIKDQVYDGSEHTLPITVTLSGTRLYEKNDYEVTYVNNLNVGKATITIRGVNAYTGTIKKTFKIKAYDIKEDTAKKIGGLQSKITCKYLKGGSKPKVELAYADIKLAEGTDYTVSYKNNKAITTVGTKKLPTITIKGKGNYRGTVVKTFTIISRALDDEEFPVTLRIADKGFMDKSGNYISKPVLIDADGKKLVSGKDYESSVVYMLENGTLLTKTSKVSVGERIKAKVKGKGTYFGELEALYQIKAEDFSKVKISIAPQTYTGKEITLDKEDITVKLRGITLELGVDYDIVSESYTNNLKKGNAEVTIVGKGNYGGMKTVKFRIVSKKFEWFWRIFG